MALPTWLLVSRYKAYCALTDKCYLRVVGLSPLHHLLCLCLSFFSLCTPLVDIVSHLCSTPHACLMPVRLLCCLVPRTSVLSSHFTNTLQQGALLKPTAAPIWLCNTNWISQKAGSATCKTTLKQAKVTWIQGTGLGHGELIYDSLWHMVLTPTLLPVACFLPSNRRARPSNRNGMGIIMVWSDSFSFSCTHRRRSQGICSH
jgi:hypothetical protein